MVSSTTITLVGDAAFISAMTRAMEVGVRDHAFSTRAFWAASSACFCARNASWRARAAAPLMPVVVCHSASRAASTSAITPASTAKL